MGAALSYLALNYWFIPKYESFTFSKADDFVPLAVFGLAAVASGLTVARVNGLRRRAEEHERAAFDARLVAAVNESRAGFLAAMTHNLRTPLASIKAAVSTLQDPQADLDAATRAQLLQIAHDESERLERLVSKVLELSRIHAGVIDPRREPTDVGELTRGAVRRLRHLAARDRVRLSVAGDVLVVSVDPEMIELVLVSVLENALRFAPPGTEVGVVAEPSDHDGCVIRVVDHGPGIPAHQREKVFEEFARSRRASRQRRIGTRAGDRARAFVDRGRWFDPGGRDTGWWCDVRHRPPRSGATRMSTVDAELLTIMLVEDDAPLRATLAAKLDRGRLRGDRDRIGRGGDRDGRAARPRPGPARPHVAGGRRVSRARVACARSPRSRSWC